MTHYTPGSKDNVNFLMIDQGSGLAQGAELDVFVEIPLTRTSLTSASGLSQTTERVVLGWARIRDSHASVRENIPLQIFLQAASATLRPQPRSRQPTSHRSVQCKHPHTMWTMMFPIQKPLQAVRVQHRP